MSYSLCWIGTNVVVRFEGTLCYRNLHHANNEIYKDARFSSMEFQIMDLHDVTDSDLTNEEVIAIGNQKMSASINNNNIKLAMVTNNPTILINQGTAYLDSLAQTDWKFQAFDCFNRAMEWCKKAV